jgi:hypothetical protein
MPSAMVCVSARATGRPDVIDPGHAAAFSACTPTTRTPGRATAAAAATPASSPPPPVGTTMVVASGTCSRISRPTDACPQTMSSWSNGWMRVRPLDSHSAIAASSAAESRPSTGTTSAP